MRIKSNTNPYAFHAEDLSVILLTFRLSGCSISVLTLKLSKTI